MNFDTTAISKSQPIKYNKSKSVHRENTNQSNIEERNDIFNQPLQKLTDVIQAAKLIDLLINKNYGFGNEDIVQLQLYDLELKTIYEKATEGKSPGFVIKNNLLYKEKGKFLLLCTPKVLTKEVVTAVHTNRNFHFSKSQCNILLSNLIWHPNLNKLVSQIIDNCLICIISQEKKTFKLVGTRRTHFYAPSECLIMDSAYLPKSTYGFSKLLILVDSCTSYTSLYPSCNLKASTVKRHLLHHLSSHKLPSVICCDHGSEFLENLDQFLASYNIELKMGKPYMKGSTSAVESHIRLVKSSLRQFCMADPKNWPSFLPLISSGINGLGLYNSRVTREMLYFSPFANHDNVNLLAFQLPEMIFNQQYSMLKHLANKRKRRLLNSSKIDPTKFHKNSLVLAVNHPIGHQKGTSDELQPVVRGIYYVKEVRPDSLRIIHCFSGLERTLPKNFCQKIDINDLALMKSSLRAHQLAKINNKMISSNKFLPKNQHKTWLNILDSKHRSFTSPQQLNTQQVPLQSDQQKLLDKNPRHNDYTPQPAPKHLEPAKSTNGGPDLKSAVKATRSGRAYSACVEHSPHLATPQSTRPKERKSVSFNTVIQYCEEGKIFSLPEKQTNDKKNITIFLHLVGLDFSTKEMIWKNNKNSSESSLTYTNSDE